MAEYFAVPIELIAIGKNHEWMKPSDERGTLHWWGQAFPSGTHTSGTWAVAGGALDAQWERHSTTGAFFPRMLNIFSQTFAANLALTEHLKQRRTSSVTP